MVLESHCAVDTDQRQQGEVHQDSGSGVLRSPVIVMTHPESMLEGPIAEGSYGLLHWYTKTKFLYTLRDAQGA